MYVCESTNIFSRKETILKKQGQADSVYSLLWHSLLLVEKLAGLDDTGVE